MADVTEYTDLLTSQYRDKPRMLAMVGGVAQPLADTRAAVQGLVAKFDLDTAEGQQLDYIGMWIGVGRALTIAITDDVFFSFDTPGLGFDEGVWFGPGSGGGEVVDLDDQSYRVLLRAKILNNQWDGTVENAYEIWDAVFEGTSYSLSIVDNGDLSIDLVLSTPDPTISAMVRALFEGSYLDVKPAGVSIANRTVLTGV